jgi:hypothetical protein
MRKDCIRTGLSSLTIALSVLASMTALASAEDVKTGDSGRQTLGPDLITFADSDAILASLKRNGIEAELVKDSDGDPKVTSSETDNPFSIHFYSCTDHDQCKFVQFTSGWNLKNGITLDKLEAWNEHKVWGQAYRDSDKDPWLAMPVNFVGGVTRDHLDDMVDWWLTIEDDFQKHIGWDKEK